MIRFYDRILINHYTLSGNHTVVYTKNRELSNFTRNWFVQHCIVHYYHRYVLWCCVIQLKPRTNPSKSYKSYAESTYFFSL